MELKVHSLYHVYNRGINRQRLFVDHDNYPFFLSKLQAYVAPTCNILAYALLPNHFHLLVQANKKSLKPCQLSRHVRMNQFSRGIQLLLSSYAKAFNHRHDWVGSLFTQNTHARQTSSEEHILDYSAWCFRYIHLNPVTAGLVKSPELWAYSSYAEYLGKSPFHLCKIELARELLHIEQNELLTWHNEMVPEHIVTRLFGRGKPPVSAENPTKIRDLKW